MDFLINQTQVIILSIQNIMVSSERQTTVDKQALIRKKQTIVIQINGKVRDNLEIDTDTPQSIIEEKAFESEKVLRFINNKNEVKKIIFIKNKILNIVI